MSAILSNVRRESPRQRAAGCDEQVARPCNAPSSPSISPMHWRAGPHTTHTNPSSQPQPPRGGYPTHRIAEVLSCRYAAALAAAARSLALTLNAHSHPHPHPHSHPHPHHQVHEPATCTWSCSPHGSHFTIVYQMFNRFVLTTKPTVARNRRQAAAGRCATHSATPTLRHHSTSTSAPHACALPALRTYKAAGFRFPSLRR